jgi:hypothetical protein
LKEEGASRLLPDDVQQFSESNIFHVAFKAFLCVNGGAHEGGDE